MNILGTAGFLAFGLAVGASLSAIVGSQPPLLPTPPVPAQSQPLPPPAEKDPAQLDLDAAGEQRQALGLLMAVSLHERSVARSASGRASPALLAMIRDHERQHEDLIAALQAMDASLDSAAAMRLLSSAEHEAALLDLLHAGEVDDAYLMAAMKCNQRLLGLVRYHVLPALRDEPSRQLAHKATSEARLRLHQIRQMRAQLPHAEADAHERAVAGNAPDHAG